MLLLGSIHALPIPNSIRLVRVLADFGHAPLFSIIAVALLYIAAARHGRLSSPTPGDYGIATIVTAALASSSELAQLTLTGRSASFVDVARDLFGGSLGLLYCLWRNGGISNGPLRLAVTAAAILTLVLGAPIFWTIAGYINRAMKWPEIVAIDSRLDFIFLHPFESDIVALPSSSNSNEDGDGSSLLIHLSGQLDSGFMIEELPSDTSSYVQICFDISNPGQTDLNVTLWLGNNTSVLRSTVVSQYSNIIPAYSRVTACDNLATANNQLKRNSSFRSLGLTAPPARAPRDLIVHRIWLE